jgi:hypothetical protein
MSMAAQDNAFATCKGLSGEALVNYLCKLGQIDASQLLCLYFYGRFGTTSYSQSRFSKKPIHFVFFLDFYLIHFLARKPSLWNSRGHKRL